MKKIFMMGCIAAAMLAGLSSCEEPETGYEGINYIYLESDASYLYDMEGASLDVSITLTTALEQDLSLNLKVESDVENPISFEENPVVIPAGERTKTVEITPNALPDGTNSVNLTITLDESTVLPENTRFEEGLQLTLLSSELPELSSDQLAIISEYNEATGIDLTKYLGLTEVSTVYTASNPDSEIPDKPVTLSGLTMITLSEKSSLGQPVLKMTANAMGLQDVLYNKLKSLTLTNPDWAPSEYAMSYSELLNAINWTTSSAETFTMTLDDINLLADKTIEFVADKSYTEEFEGDEYYTEVFKVPFEFYFSAFEREKEQIAAGNIGTEANPDWLYDATVDPDYWLNCDNIKTDEYEPGYNESTEEYYSINWVESTATISAEKLEFTFCLYNYNDYDYSKVIATYTPNE